MRRFAKICVEDVQDGGDVAKRLEGVLNSEVAICDVSKSEVFQPKDHSAREDYHTVHPNILAQADFQFLPAGLKIARIEEYERMKNELRKTREIKEMLQDADKHGSHTQRRLMNSPSSLNQILEHIDADPLTCQEHGKMSDLWYFERMKKITGSVDGLVSKIIEEDFGHAEIGWNNIEQLYNPHVSGVYSIDDQKRRLVAAGMSVNLAEELSRQYLSKLGRQSRLFSLMDFFSSERAKKALHDQSLDMKQICMNYEIGQNNIRAQTTLQSGLKAHALSQLGKIKPVRPIIQAVRGFSTSQIQTSSDSEEEGMDNRRDATQTDGKKQGRFFKFLQSAEKLDEKIKDKPDLAKKVFTGEKEEEEEVVMFDASEIEISLADQAAESAKEIELA